MHMEQESIIGFQLSPLRSPCLSASWTGSVVSDLFVVLCIGSYFQGQPAFPPHFPDTLCGG